ncbi:PD-(D/E)XK nuclease family transposase [uncultured Dialister sp.]|uniref:PD-(D/E)XK nuclease family transposase n=1 Tax=uncultured Dialister sp. TaxID=278064 RepID=UPI002608C0AE|nr:PD-(D/E)XK nuclease family transposase [uncultured Dialister sp.]
MEEFKDCSIADIRDRYIIGIPETASVPVLPDETNAAAMVNADRISGERTEDTSVTEGKVTFDIRFRAITPCNELVQLIINIEAQRSRHTSYPLMKRAMYYVSRLISSQYGVDFDKAQYGKIKKVYSIWLCMDAPDDRGGITRYRMQEETEYGNILDEKENYDLQQVVMVYVAHARADMENRLLNLLGELFVSEDDASRKKAELIEHYDIDLNDDEERLVSTMCNLSVGLYEKGMEKNSNQIIINLLRMHMGIDFIKKATGRSEEDIKKLAEENHLPI